MRGLSEENDGSTDTIERHDRGDEAAAEAGLIM
jgi:hypothetical protein